MQTGKSYLKHFRSIGDDINRKLSCDSMVVDDCFESDLLKGDLDNDDSISSIEVTESSSISDSCDGDLSLDSLFMDNESRLIHSLNTAISSIDKVYDNENKTIEIMEALIDSNFTLTQTLIFLAVFRNTYLMNKKMVRITNDALGAMVKKDSRRCSTEKNKLFSKKILVQEGRKIGINENISEWIK